MRLIVNGSERGIPNAWRDETLLSTLREQLGLTGAKYSCGIGLCGACSVQVDGVPVNSCSVRTADVEGRRILTIEGLAAPDGRLHPLQQAWIGSTAKTGFPCSRSARKLKVGNPRWAASPTKARTARTGHPVTDGSSGPVCGRAAGCSC